jgi:small subunit ribosomal protein S16
LRRAGKKKMPIYHIVAADSRAARNGKFLEIVGRYEPQQEPLLVSAKEDRVFYWLRNGALPTDTVRSLFQRNGLWMKWSMTKSGKTASEIAAAMEQWQLAQAARQERDRARKARRSAARRKAKKPESEAAAPAPEAATPAAQG